MTMKRLRSLALMNIHNQQDVNFTHVFCLFCSTIQRKSMKVNCYLSNPDSFSCALYKTCILNFLKMPLNFLKSPSPTYSYSEKKNILLKYFTKEKLLSTFLPKQTTLPSKHRTYIERTQDVQKTSWTSSKRLMYVQLTSCIYGVSFFYKQPVYKQRALGWQSDQQLSGLNLLSLSSNKIYRLHTSGVFPL